jgi:cytosine/adenosine deaminase-related metal-dependent hydrolase
MAMLLQRVRGNPAGLTAEGVLWIATRGGADVLGRDDVGQLAPGKTADFIALRLDALEYAGGAVHDPLAATVFCHPRHVDLSVINGRVVVEDGQLCTIDLNTTIERHNNIAKELVQNQ